MSNPTPTPEYQPIVWDKHLPPITREKGDEYRSRFRRHDGDWKPITAGLTPHYTQSDFFENEYRRPVQPSAGERRVATCKWCGQEIELHEGSLNLLVSHFKPGKSTRVCCGSREPALKGSARPAPPTTPGARVVPEIDPQSGEQVIKHVVIDHKNRTVTEYLPGETIPTTPGATGETLWTDEECLMHAIVLLHSWHEDGTAWSDWDTQVEANLVAFQKRWTLRLSEIELENAALTQQLARANGLFATINQALAQRDEQLADARRERDGCTCDDDWLNALAKAGWPDAVQWGEGAEHPSEGRQSICNHISEQLEQCRAQLAAVTAERDHWHGKVGLLANRLTGISDNAPTDDCLKAIEDVLTAFKIRVEQFEKAHENFDPRLVELLERCQSGQATCIFTAQVIEADLESRLAAVTAELQAMREERDAAIHECENVWRPAATMNEQYARAYETQRDALQSQLDLSTKAMSETIEGNLGFADGEQCMLIKIKIALAAIAAQQGEKPFQNETLITPAQPE